jgi:hypothetical protein
VKRAALASLAAAAVLTGCGGFLPHGKGHATIWITRERGTHVVLVKKVDAGVSAMQALNGVAKVKTRYGGRFVTSIDGVAGDASARRDWFYFINGYEADRSAADYKLHDGDVEWWDFRSWKKEMRVPIVVGAFPEPFLHGYGGKTRKATVLLDSASLRKEAEGLAKLVHAKSLSQDQLADANILFLTSSNVPFSAVGGEAGAPVRFTIGAKQARRLIADPKLARYRYEGLP